MAGGRPGDVRVEALVLENTVVSRPQLYKSLPRTRVGVNSAPELDFLANSKSNSGIGIELELALPSPGGIGIAII